MERHVIKAAIFDMDGLLINSEPLWRKAEIEVFSTVGISLTEDDCRETMGYRLNEVVELWYQRKPWTGKSVKAVEEEILARVSQLIGEEGEILPGVESAIAQCQDFGHKLAIASSSPMTLIHSVVKLLGMENAFSVLHSAQFEKFGKPHPAVFISAANKLDVLPEACIVFEDSFHGVVAGLAAKMKVIAVPESKSYSDPKFQSAHLVLKSLEEFDLEFQVNGQTF
ncbi:MAG: hexitol phosphatase HxpB [Flavobacteriales bacterium]|nr:hexitol phosphatase HxpB [Flavobacteriales bacterium]